MEEGAGSSGGNQWFPGVYNSITFIMGSSLISHFINYCFTMFEQDSLDEDIITIKSRDYKCPCGKTYLSYAALFTHIKQKHDGQVTPSICSHPEK